MAAHRYWRLLLSAVNTNSRAAVAELQMRGSLGGATLCTGGTILASGTSSGMVAANAFDGNTTTEWNSEITGGIPWIGYDFGTPVSVLEISVRSSANSFMLSAWGLLQWSDNGTAWSTMGPQFAPSTASTTYVFNGFADVVAPRLAGSGLRLPTAWPTNTARARVLGLSLRSDLVDGGAYRIDGDVAIEATPVIPVSRVVLLFTADSYRLIRSTWSDAVTGAYSFPNLRLQKYIVLTRDYTRAYNAVVADEITPGV